MPSHLSSYLRERIVALWEEGKKVSEIVTTLESEGKRTSRATVQRWVFRWRTNRGLRDRHRSGRLLKITVEISSVELQRLISRKFSINISAPTIRRHIRMHLKWVVLRTRFGPMISDKNKVKRSTFAQMCLDTEDSFDNVIWTDESSVQLTRHSQMMRVKMGKERVLYLGLVATRIEFHHDCAVFGKVHKIANHVLDVRGVPIMQA